MKCCSFYLLDRNQSWCPLRVILFLGLLLGFVTTTTPEAAAQLPILRIEDASRLEGDIRDGQSRVQDVVVHTEP